VVLTGDVSDGAELKGGNREERTGARDGGIVSLPGMSSIPIFFFFWVLPRPCVAWGVDPWMVVVHGQFLPRNAVLDSKFGTWM